MRPSRLVAGRNSEPRVRDGASRSGSAERVGRVTVADGAGVGFRRGPDVEERLTNEGPRHDRDGE